MNLRWTPRVRRLSIVLAVVAIALTSAIFAALLFVRPATRIPAAEPMVVPTTDVTRGDLSVVHSFSGSVDHGTANPIIGKGGGVLTWTAPAGGTVSRGEPLYRVDEKPVPLFYGDLPLYRSLAFEAASTGPTTAKGLPAGRDVGEVIDNLTALGFLRGQPAGADNSEFTPALADGIRAWQRSLGMPRTGSLDPGTVAVEPHAVRIAAIKAELGSAVDTEIMDVTDVATVADVQVPVAQLAGITPGTRATLDFADGSSTAAQVVSVQTSTSQDQDPQDTTPKVDVQLSWQKSSLPSFGNVTAHFTAETRRDVLTVPVNALLAVQGGALAVQRQDGSLIAVTTGLFASGRVEVSGHGLREGMQVVIPG